MDVQSIFVTLIFVAALFYIGRFIYRSASQKEGGCGSCSGSQCKVDFSKIDTPEKKR